MITTDAPSSSALDAARPLQPSIAPTVPVPTPALVSQASAASIVSQASCVSLASQASFASLASPMDERIAAIDDIEPAPMDTDSIVARVQAAARWKRKGTLQSRAERTIAHKTHALRQALDAMPEGEDFAPDVTSTKRLCTQLLGGRASWCNIAPALLDAAAPSVRLEPLRAQAAPRHSTAPHAQLGASPWPQQPASGRPKVDDSAPQAC